MTKQNPVIVYLGEEKHALAFQSAVEVYGWTVMIPDSMMETLAMHIFYYPDAFVIEDTAEFDHTRDTFAHLRSVGASNLAVLTNAPGTWGIPSEAAVTALPTYTSIDALIDTLTTMMEGQGEVSLAL